MAEPPTAPAPDVATADPPTSVGGWSVSAATPDAAADAPTDRRRRQNRWDRPKPPHDWRFWVGGLGRVLIVTGLLLLGFVAYQLWGTGIETARAQRGLENDFEELLANAPAATVVDEPEDAATPGDEVFIPTDENDAGEGAEASEQAPSTLPLDDDSQDDPEATEEVGDDAATDADGETPDAPEVVPVDQQLIPLVENGDALFRLEIPAIGANDIVVAGVETSDLKRGPGHFPETPLPGQLGNSAVAGHRTTYGQPFHNVDQLEPGDEMIVTTLSGTFVYVVTGQEIVTPSDYHVISTTDPTTATLALVSCDPKWTAANRIVIHGILDPERSAAIGEPVLNYGQPVEPATDVETTTTPDDTGAEPAEPPSSGVSGSLVTEVDERLVGVDALASGTANAGTANAFTEGWFSDSDAYAQVALWAAALIAIWAGAYLLARHFRRTWIGLAVGVVPFVVALYFFYQNVNRMLPPGL